MFRAILNKRQDMGIHLAKADLVFVHLSDIHFRHGRTGDVHDEDKMLRNELELDLRRLRARLPRIDGLIVSGDIAFGGQSAEYEYALGWIETIREQLGCVTHGVMITPGNHDVDRGEVTDGGPVDSLQRDIRSGNTIGDHDAALARCLRDPTNGPTMFLPLTNYNAFARNYGCQINCENPYWERDFGLSDGTILRFRGVASTLLSGKSDNEHTHKMLYGGAQRTILRQANVRYALVGHHPPSWTIEGDFADQTFSALTFLQVFGHKHDQWLTVIGNSVRLIAGAVHPSREELNWQPRYSAICISALNHQLLGLRVYPRRWSTEDFTFIGDFNLKGLDYREYQLRVEPRQP
jgi:3',5'-cyclic AMP phosphodiesterase CpdA